MRESHTAVLERNVEWSGAFAVEPYEVGWASEAIYFSRALAVTGERQGKASEDELKGACGRVQISPDGMHWCDEGTAVPLPKSVGEVTFARVAHFGNWLRVVGELPDGVRLKVVVALALKE